MDNLEFTPQEQQLIMRLQRAPQAKLSEVTVKSIELRLLEAMDTPVSSVPSALTPALVFSGVVILIIVIAVIVLSFSGQFAPNITPNPTATATVTTTLTPTSTATLVATTSVTPISVATIDTSVNTILITPTALPSFTPTVQPTVAVTPIVDGSTPTAIPMLVVEGAIESIKDNVVTIYNIDLTLNPDNALLPSLQVGDVVRIEGNFDDAQQAIIAVSLEVVNVDISVNAETGEAWRDSGNCNNPPPAWAPANGWRKRCEVSPQTGDTNGGDDNNGMGMGKKGD